MKPTIHLLLIILSISSAFSVKLSAGSKFTKDVSTVVVRSLASSDGSNVKYLNNLMQEEQYELISMFIKAGSIPKNSNFQYEFLSKLIEKEQYELISMLIESGSIPKNSNFQYEFLSKLIEKEQYELISMLIESGSIPIKTELVKLARDDFLSGDNVGMLMFLLDSGIITKNSRIMRNGDVSLLESAIRNNEIKLVQLLLEKNGTNDIMDYHPEHYIYKNDILSCLSDPDDYCLETYLFGCISIIEHIDFNPLITVQNGCSTLVRLIDGSIYEFKNTDAEKFRDDILKEKYGSDYSEEFAVLEIYSSPGHAFIGIICDDCGKGSEAIEYAIGHYPRGDPLNPDLAFSDYDNIIYNKGNQLLAKMKVHNQPGWLADEKGTGYFKRAYTENHLKLKFVLDKKIVQQIHNNIQAIKEECVNNSHHCYYNLLFRNCVNIVQELMEQSGLKGDYREYFTDEELGHGYFDKFLKGGIDIDNYKASIFSFVATRPFVKSLKNLIYATIQDPDYSAQKL